MPDALPALKRPLDVEYTVRWQREKDMRPPLAWVAQTRRGHGYSKDPDPSIGFVIDFEGPVFAKLPTDANVESVVTADPNGEIVENHPYRNDVTGGYRLRLRVKQIDDKKPVELRAFLRAGETTLTPTWSYVLPGE